MAERDLDVIFAFKKRFMCFENLRENLKCSRNPDVQRFGTEEGTCRTQGLCDAVSTEAEETDVCAEVWRAALCRG